MSVDFWSDDVAGSDEMGRRHSFNLANGNAADLLEWLELPNEPGGEVPARELAARCRRRLWPIPQNFDPALPGTDSGEGALSVVDPDGSARMVRGEPGPRVIYGGRREGYLRERTEQLLVLAEAAGDGLVRWG